MSVVSHDPIHYPGATIGGWEIDREARLSPTSKNSHGDDEERPAPGSHTDSKVFGWLQRLDKDVQKLGFKGENLTESINELHKKMDALLSDIKSSSLEFRVMIYGAGKDDPGLLGRVRDLEQAETRRSWWMKAIIVAVIAALVTGAGGAITSMLRVEQLINRLDDMAKLKADK